MKHDSHSEARRRGHEVKDVPLKGVVLFIIATIVVAAVLHWALGVMYHYWAREHPPARAVPTAWNQPQPDTPASDLADLTRGTLAQAAREQELLESHGWIDETNRIARLPIARAMELLLERGVPARPPTAAKEGGER